MVKPVLSLLGSTGSIGEQTLDVVRRRGYRVAALAANRSVDTLYRQALEFRPELVAVYDEAAAEELRARLRPEGIRVAAGEEGLCEAAALPGADVTLTAVVGMVGLRPTLEAIGAGKRIALANKETLVAGGDIVMERARAKGVPILPVDSEHSAIFQSMLGCADRREVRKLLLTASGGPFFGRKRKQLSQITPAEAVAHPNWKMGRKISVDSATLMNKGLELIEAMHLFSVPPERIQVVVHRESVVHSMVEYVDGCVMAQLSSPDMRLPIQLALTYPERAELDLAPLDFAKLGSLTFAEPDEETFPALALCREAAVQGGSVPAALNGANEAAVALFLTEKIPFLAIDRLLSAFLAQYAGERLRTVEDVIRADRAGRAFIEAHAAEYTEQR